MTSHAVLTHIYNDFTNFKQSVDAQIESALNDLTYADIEVEATSAHYYECDGINVELNSSAFMFDQLSVAHVDSEKVQLSVNVNISIDVTADFSLSTEDGCDGDTVSLAGTSETETVEFDTPVLIDILFYAEDADYDIDSVGLSSLPSSVNFGELEPDYS
jgi:hypothetical protein